MRKSCQNKELNKKECPCEETYCEKRGFCCECIAYHRANASKPACMR